MIPETAILAMSDLFCDQCGFDGTFRMAVEDQSLDGAVGRMEDALTSASVRRVAIAELQRLKHLGQVPRSLSETRLHHLRGA
jgi:hypothetical protein